MKQQRKVTFPHFIRLTRMDNNDIWVNANNINEILVFGGKTVIVYGGGDDNCRDVKETPPEIFERIYDNPSGKLTPRQYGEPGGAIGTVNEGS